MVFLRINSLEKIVVTLHLILGLSLLQGQNIDSTNYIIGTITSEGRPLLGAQVWIEKLELGSITDGRGMFQLGPLDEGDYEVNISFIGYEKKVISSVVKAGEQINLTIELRRSVIKMKGVMVTPKEEVYDPEGITARLSTRMIQEAPGAAQDIFLVLQTLPGVTSGGDDSKLFVRGGKPEENLVIYDGATISNPFHFDFIGGGFYSIFNSSQVENVEFYSGGFPARYGDRLSSVMVIENRTGNRENLKTELSLSMADVKGLIEFPISGKATTIFSARRSYFDLLLGKSGFGGKFDLFPFFYDVNSKTDIFLTERQRLSINLLYSMEKMSGEFDEPHWVGNHTWLSENWTTALRLRSLFSPNFSSDLNIYWSEGYNQASHADGVGTENTRKGEIALKEDLVYSKGAHESHLGFWLVLHRSDMEIELPLDLAYNFEELYFESKGTAIKAAAYIEDTWEINNWLSMNYGLRADYVVISSEITLSPRINVVFTPMEKVQLTANYGLYTQSPPAYELKINQTQPSRRSKTWGIGINGRFTSDIYWSLEAYSKRLSRLMTIDSRGSFSGNGKGRNSGIELYLQKKAGSKFIGWLSLTYSVSRRREGTAQEVTLFDYDQTYLASAVGQYRPSEKWQMSVRFRYATGRPYTPANGGWFNQDVGRYFPYIGERNSSRYSSYHRLDFRMARYIPSLFSGLTLYFETINTYNRDNVAYYIWSDDFSDKRNFTVFPFIPILGIDLKL